MTEPDVPPRPEADVTPPSPLPERPDAGAGAWPTTDTWPSSTSPAATGPAAPEPRRSRSAVVIAAIVAFALLGGAATYLFLGSDGSDDAGSPARAGGRATLALAFERGDRTTYDIHMTMHGSLDAGGLGRQPLDMDASETVGWRVVDVAHDGTATVRLTVSNVSGSMNGMDVPAGTPGTSTTVTVTPDGRVLDADGIALGSTGTLGMAEFPGMNQLTPVLPDHPVRPGDTWDKTFSQKFPFGDGAIEYTAHSAFLRYEEVGGVRAAVVQTRYRVPLDFTFDMGKLGGMFGGATDTAGLSGKDAVMTFGGSGAFAQTSWLDLRAEQLLRMTSKGDFDMTISMPALAEQMGTDEFSMSATFSMDLTRR